ncbi:MAG: PLP-dependent aminotransferase family protein [Eubacteriales bacterium]
MNELTMQLDLKDKKHLYEQIYEYIKREIVEGRLAQGERLPSTRALSQHLQVSRSTVTLSYDQLLSEGYIESRPYTGFFVSNMADLYQIPTLPDKGKVSEKVQVKKYDYIFSPTAVDMAEFPYATWKKISKETLIDERSEMFALGSSKGDYNLRVTIGQYLHASRGVNCDPDQIIVGAGNDYLLMLLQLLFPLKAIIGFENPTYKKAYRIFTSLGFTVKPLSMDEYGMSVEALEKSEANLAYVMPSHQYPTGTIMPIGRRMELLKWAGQKENRYIIEDDYDSEFRYKGKPIPSLQGADKEGNVIYLGTFSKSIAPAIRVSYMVLPKKLLKEYEERISFVSSTVSRIDQTILDEFIRSGAFERYLNKMRKIYKGKHDVLMNGLKPFRRKFYITGEHAGLHVLLQAKFQVDEELLCEQAEAVGVKVYPLSDHKVAPITDYQPTVILGYAGLTEKEIIQGLQCLEKAWL